MPHVREMGMSRKKRMPKMAERMRESDRGRDYMTGEKMPVKEHDRRRMRMKRKR